MAKTITGIKVGQTTITATYGGVTSNSVPFTVSKAAGYVNTAPTNANAVYGSGNSLISNATAVSNSASGTMMYRVGTTGNFSSTVPTTSGLNAGTYTLYYYAAESASYNQSATGSISVTVAKASGTATVTGLTQTYNGSTNSNGTAQAMVSVSGNTGTMHYRVGTSGTWTTTIPTRINAGSDTIYYYMDTSTNYAAQGSSSSPWGSVTGTMNRAKTATASASDKTYNGTNNTNGTAQTATSGSHVTWTGDTSGTNAGDYTAYATPESNFAWSDGTYNQKTVTWTMDKRGQGAPTLQGAETTYPTTATATVKTAGKIAGGSTDCPGTLTWSNQSRSTAGTQTATAYYAAMSNFYQSPTSTGVTVKVNQASGTATVTGLTKTYNGTTNSDGTAQNMVSVSGNTGTMHYKVGTGGSWTTTIPTRTNAGSDTIYYYMDASSDGNYTAMGSSSSPWGNVTGTMNRAKTATASASDKTYNGTNNTNGTAQTATSGSHVTWSGATSGTNAGDYTAYATPESNFAWSDGSYAQKTITWTMDKRGQGAPTLQGAETTYPTTATATVKTAGKIAGGSTDCPGTLTWSNQSRSTAGTQTATAYYAAMSNFYQSPVSAGVSVTVNQAEGTATVTGLTQTYNGTTNSDGTPQAMVSVSGNTGTMHYRVGAGGTWTTTIPTRTNAGSDTIYYYMDASTNYTGKGSSSSPWGSVTGTMNRAKTASASAVTGLVYNGTTEDNSTATSQTGVTYAHVTLDSGSVSGKDAGSYSAKFTPESNFAWSDGSYAQKTVSWSIARRGQGAPTLQGAETTYPTTATATVKTAGVIAGGTATCPGTLTWSNQSRSVAGTQTATAYYAATAKNFSASSVSAGVTVKVNQATGTATITGLTQTYNGSTNSDGTAQAMVSVSGNTGTMHYRVGTSGSWTTTIPTRTVVGSDTIYYYMDASDNYTGRGSSSSPWGSVTGTMNRAKTASYSVSDKTYNGTNNTNGTAQTAVTGTHVTLSGNTSGTNAGDYTAYATPESNFAWSDGTYAQVTINWTMNKRGQGAPVLQGAETTYPTTATATVKTAGVISGGTATCPGTLIWSNQSRSTAGSQTATAYYAAMSNFSQSPTSDGVTVKVNQATGTATVTGLTKTYNGSTNSDGTAQPMVSVTGNTGTMHYRVGTTGSWTTTIPTRINAGSDTIYYYMDASDNYTGRGSSSSPWGSVTGTMNRATTASYSSSNKTYNGTNNSNGTSQTAVTGTHVTLSGSTSGTNAGDYTAYATPESNFAWSDGTYAQKTINWTMNKRGQGAPTLQGAETTYPTTAIATVKTAGVISGGTATCPGTLTWSNQSRSTAGSQTATAYYAATSNFSQSPASAGVTVKVNQATPTFTLSGESKAYHNTSSVTATVNVAGTVYWGTTSATSGMSTQLSFTSSGTKTVTSRTDLGTTTVHAYFVPSDTTNYKSLGSSSSEHTNAAAVITQATDASVSATRNTDASTLIYNPTTPRTLVTATKHGTSMAKIGYKKGSAATSDSEITWVDVGNSATNLTASDAGTYYVYYKFEPDGNHSNSASYTAVSGNTVVISKATATLPVTISGDAKYYHDGSNNVQTARATVSKDYVGGTLKYSTDSGSTWNNVTWSSGNLTSAPSRNTVGSTSVVFKVFNTDGNYNDSSVSSPAITLTINKNEDAQMEVPVTTRTYTGSPQVIASGSNVHGISTYYIGYRKDNSATPTSDSQLTWSSANGTLSATNAGTYYIYYKFTCDGNHTTSDGQTSKTTTYVGSVKINQAAANLTYSTESSITHYCTETANAYSSTDVQKTWEIGTSPASSSTNGTAAITYSTSKSGWTNNGTTLTVPAGTAAGTYNITVSATVAADPNGNYPTKTVTNDLTVIITAVTLTGLALELNATEIAYGSSTTVKQVIATYSNTKTKDVISDATYSATKDTAGDDIVTITTTP